MTRCLIVNKLFEYDLSDDFYCPASYCSVRSRDSFYLLRPDIESIIISELCTEDDPNHRANCHLLTNGRSEMILPPHENYVSIFTLPPLLH